MPPRTSLTKIITPEQGHKLRSILESRSYELKNVNYAYFGASSKSDKISLTYYKSGKLLIQGKGLEEFVTFTLEPQVLQSFEFGYEDVSSPEYDEKVGIDESGKGDYFGPLVVAGCFVPRSFLKKIAELGLKDSKKMSDKKIRTVAPQIMKNIPFTRIIIGPKKYNELYSKIKNLNRLLAWGHSRAIENMLETHNYKLVMLDQFANENVVKKSLLQKGKNVQLIQRTKAESDPAVACASILARYFFLKSLEKMEETYEQEFPKGVSPNVKEKAKDFVKNHGEEKLNEIAKLHFKTTLEIAPSLFTESSAQLSNSSLESK